jgi:hypothetical protein
VPGQEKADTPSAVLSAIARQYAAAVLQPVSPGRR